MTVCISAVCDSALLSPKILFCADRLVTDSNGLTFEQGMPKIFQICENCLVMNAGLGYEADQIIRSVVERVTEKMSKDEKLLSIKEIASIFKEEHQKLRSEKVNDEILKPRGLTLDAFYRDIKSFPDWLGIMLDNQISGYNFGVHFLVIGFDLNPEKKAYYPRMYQINETGETSLLDATGFGIIGIGDMMSLPELTRDTYSFNTPLNEAAVRIYWAKKSAERVVGVGSETTDFGMMWCEPKSDGTIKVNAAWLSQVVLDELKKDYDEHSMKIKTLTKGVQKNIEDIIAGKKESNLSLK